MTDVRQHDVETRVAAALLIGGVILTVASRALVAYAGFPSVVNFAHYPMVLGATLMLTSSASDRAFLAIVRAMAAFLMAGMLSWVWNGDQSIIAPLLNWLVFGEVFLIAAAIIELGRRGWSPRNAERTAVGLVLVQVPLGLYQLATSGLGDPVQGLLIGQGAGAHVFGFMALIMTLWLLGSIISGRSLNVARDLAIASIGFIVAVMTDAKQGIAVFVIVCAFLVFTSRSERRVSGLARKAVLVVAVTALVFAAFQLNTSSREIANVERRDTFVSGKLTAVVEYAGAMRDEVGGVVLGLGPGKTASRVAWLAPSDSTLQELGVTPSELTSRLYWLWNNDPRSDTSTGAAPFFSWLGIVGDVGLIGLAAYAWCWALLWRLAGPGSFGTSARALIVFGLALGVLFNWLEEPALIAVLGLLVGALIARARAGRMGRADAAHLSGGRQWRDDAANSSPTARSTVPMPFGDGLYTTG